VPVKHDDFALLILIIRGADMNLNWSTTSRPGVKTVFSFTMKNCD